MSNELGNGYVYVSVTSQELRTYSKAYSSRPSLIAQSLANRSADDYIIYDVRLGLAEMFHQR